MSSNFLKRPGNVVLGALYQLASQKGFNLMTLRIILIISTLLIPLLGIFIYFILALLQGKITKIIIAFSIIGAILGIPFSYYLNPNIVFENKSGIVGYLKNIDLVLFNSNSLAWLILSIFSHALIGFFIGCVAKKYKQ